VVSVNEGLLVGLVLTNLFYLATGRLGTYVKLFIVQTLLVSFFGLVVNQGYLSTRVIILSVIGLVIKAFVFPALLTKSIRTAKLKREIQPLVGFGTSLFIGILMFGLSSWLGSRMPMPVEASSRLVVPVVFFTVFTGLFLIISRSKAITEVISYLVLENGIYLFGISFVKEAPMLAELGVLLDVTVAIFVMGIVIRHLRTEFESLDVNKLSTLKDWGV